jgi:hypothetical protein
MPSKSHHFTYKLKKHSKKFSNKSRKQYGSGFINDKELINPANLSGNRFFQTTTLNQLLTYVIPSNTIAFKNVESARVPAFNIFSIDPQTNTPSYIPCNLKRGKKFINYLVNINNEWYAIMRIFRALNTGVFSAWTNTIFYKFSPNSLIFNPNTFNIHFNPSCYTVTKESALGIFRSDNNFILVFNDSCLSPITSGPIFKILQRLRNEQIITYGAKMEGARVGIDILRAFIG